MYIKYQLEDGSILLVESAETDAGVVKASAFSEKLQEAQHSFDQALESAKCSAMMLRKQFEASLADEVEIAFGLKATGEIGNNMFAVGKASVEANYVVTLKWKKKEDGKEKGIQTVRRRRQIRKR